MTEIGHCGWGLRITFGMSAIRFLIRAAIEGRLAALEEIGRAYPVAGAFRIGPRTGVIVNTPELVEEVLVHRTDEFRKGPALRIHSRPLLGNGLLTSEGEEHRKHRKLVAPAFAHQRVPKYADVMIDSARTCCESWPASGVLDMHREMTRLTLAIVGTTLFDVDLLHDADDIGKHITELIRFATNQTRAPFSFPYSWPVPANIRARRSVDHLNRTMFGMIQRRRESGIDNGDLLSMLLMSRDDEGSTLSDEQVRDEAMTLFVAGHETTANATTWALLLLARHPDIQQHLQEQVRRVVGRRRIAFEDLPRLPLTLQVLKEAMRLYPPAFIIVREALHDLELRGGVRVRAGEIVAMCEYILHRRAEHFPDPTRFDPDRFTPENEARLPRYAYFPFGAGRRICIGNQFALMEGQIILATAMQHASVSPAVNREIKGDPLLTLRPSGPVRLRVSRLS